MTLSQIITIAAGLLDSFEDATIVLLAMALIVMVPGIIRAIKR